MASETGSSETGSSEAGISETGTSEAAASEIYPRRLVFFQLGCMFCENPQGPTYITHVALEDKMGYMSCGE